MQGPAPRAKVVFGRQLDSLTDASSRKIQQDQQPFGSKQSSHITDQSLFTPIDPPELFINIIQQQFRVDKDFWAQRSYTLRQVGSRSSGEHHKGFGDGLVKVNLFNQKHTRHEKLITNDWKAFQRELDIELFLDTVRMDLNENNFRHHHDRNHDHDHDYDHKIDKGDHNSRGNRIEYEQGRKGKSLEFSVGPEDDWSQRLQRLQAHERQIARQRIRMFRIRQNQQKNY
ncbi:MAG: hypothetical protein EZS28_005052 [Streblomastix strix]|uniref:Uncharacterized protein n=1 Tax=Streblomastix strix TaxID=222440 RepID=A0A5J4WXA1_9EUKA|nr:MAG: hypothetical protein EZS28_005052 [Streblomastix strix]